MRPWVVTGTDVAHLRGPGGTRFAEVMDAVLAASAAVLRVPPDRVRTNMRTNLPDAGVDAEVHGGNPADPCGWMTLPTCWQYRAVERTSIGPAVLREEMAKRRVQECLAAGLAYRFAIADSMTPDEIAAWERILAEACGVNDSNPLRPRVLAAEDVARFVSRFWGVVLHLRPWQEDLMHLDAWGSGITNLTPHYGVIDRWRAIREALARFVDFREPVSRPAFRLSGPAGVGKTRLVYEVVRSLPGAAELTLYTNDERKGRGIAASLANEASAHAVLVLDESSAGVRSEVEEILAGATDRVRVVSVDNDPRRVAIDPGSAWLDPIATEDTDGVLEANFPGTPAERRREYARMAGGAVRIAVELCREDPLSLSGALTAPHKLEDYYERRLEEADRRLVEGLSLLRRVGYRAPNDAELRSLCAILRLEPSDVLERAERLKDAPGWIARAGPFLYVTPEAIARIAFRRAWSRWIRDSEDFVSRLPESLRMAFLQRASDIGGTEVGQDIGRYFRQRVDALRPVDLTDDGRVSELVELVELEPSLYGTALRRLVASASPEILRAVAGPHWGTRRLLVVLTQKLAAFNDYLDDAEDILWHLALHESEPGIGNNATGVWASLFQVYVSGTSTPFERRLGILEQRLGRAKNAEEAALAATGLRSILRLETIGMGRESAVFTLGGQVEAGMWMPATRKEARACVASALGLVSALREEHPGKEAAIAAVLDSLHALVSLGLLAEVRGTLGERVANDQRVRTRLVDALEEALLRQSAGALARDIRKWLDEMRPTTLHDRLVDAASKDPWRYGALDPARDASWQEELRSLARELIASPADLDRELPWLLGPEARSADRLGHQLGREDVAAVHLSAIVSVTLRQNATALGAAYVRGLLDAHPEHTALVNEALDRAEDVSPAVAFGLALGMPRLTRALVRGLRAVAQGVLPPVRLQAFVSCVDWLEASDVVELLQALLGAMERGDRSAEHAALLFLMVLLEHRPTLLQDDDVAREAWRFLERSDAGESGWEKLAAALSALDPARVARAAAVALTGNRWRPSSAAVAALRSLGATHPEDVMRGLGERLLDTAAGEIFYYTPPLHELVSAIPAATVRGWLERAGMEGARRLARHLPSPFVDEHGQAIVPEITEWMLARFGEDERVFHEFCAGVHGFESHWGDMSEVHEREAEVARRFRDHPVPAVREWARIEEAEAREQAQREREYEAVERIP